MNMVGIYLIIGVSCVFSPQKVVLKSIKGSKIGHVIYKVQKAMRWSKSGHDATNEKPKIILSTAQTA